LANSRCVTLFFVTALAETGSLPPKLGRYELITRIGQGGMAEVQLALQRGPAGFEKLVVVKLVHENLASQKPFVDMLLDEARVAALVKHPNVVDIYDLGEAEGRYFIAMEYLEGEPLLAVLRAGRDGQRLDVLSTARLIADTAEGLDAAHELRSMAGDAIELVHHDISLGNIVVLYNGQVKLVDFGVAKASQSAAARIRVQGKYGYMAPEKLRGAPGDRRSDIWSLGCVLWEALTLRRLFKGGNDAETRQQVFDIPILAPSKINGDVPADFDPIVLRSLARDPARRYPTAKAIAADIEEVLRKHGYAAKNDTIARYMQATFHDHIAARKKLLQEVSSKGRPSQDVLEAAFSIGALASGSPVTANESWSRPHVQLPLPRTRRSSDPPPLPGSRATANGPAAAGDGPTEIERPPLRTRRRWVIFAAGAAAIALGVATATVLIARSSDSTAELFPHAAPPGAASPVAVGEAPGSAEPELVVEPDDQPAAVTADSAGNGPTHAAASLAAATTSEPVSRPSRRHGSAPRAVAARPPSDRPGADELFKEGVQAFMRGDSRTAIALCKRATQASPGFGPAWRLMGVVHERLGEKSGARAAFEKYLQVSPGAGDADDIRHRLEAL
jgi:eukaryotic-like serine/threonine-protein kinase